MFILKNGKCKIVNENMEKMKYTSTFKTLNLFLILFLYQYVNDIFYKYLIISLIII